jgi:CRP/FNR family transcriptional regulator
MDPLATLGRHPYFAALPAHILKAVATRVVVRAYERGALVYMEEEPSHGLYLVASGGVRVFKASDDGKEQDLHHIGPGQSFSDAAAFDGNPTVANAQAIEPSVVLLIRREALLDLIREYPEIGVAVIGVLAARLREVSGLAGDLALRRLTPRVAGVVLRLAELEPVATLPTRHELAAMVGTVREVATRALRHLEDIGLVRLEGRRVRILDRAGLRRLAGVTELASPLPPARPGEL